MKFSEVFNEKILLLPKEIPNNKDYKAFIKELLSDYLKLLNSIDENQFLIEGLKTPKTKKSVINIQRKFIDGLNETIDAYLNGQPADAYQAIDNTINYRTKKFSSLLNFLTFDNGENFYRIRIKDENTAFTSEEMFHIPFEARGKVATQRYSIPGFPSLYLSKTLYVAWEELKRPNINAFQATRLCSTDSIKLLNLTPTNWGDNNQVSDAYKYLMTWPLIACCSIKVKNHNDYFKPEYIIPQLLLQWIRNKKEIDGIMYYSTNINYNSLSKNGDLFNVVLPVKENKRTGYCSHLKKLFKMTNAVSWQLKEYAVGGQEFYYGKDEFKSLDEKIPNGIELISGRSYPYSYSILGNLEFYLDGMELHSFKDNLK